MVYIQEAERVLRVKRTVIYFAGFQMVRLEYLIIKVFYQVSSHCLKSRLWAFVSDRVIALDVPFPL